MISGQQYVAVPGFDTQTHKQAYTRVVATLTLHCVVRRVLVCCGNLDCRFDQAEVRTPGASGTPVPSLSSRSAALSAPNQSLILYSTLS
jgi:hypothetical protein